MPARTSKPKSSPTPVHLPATREAMSSMLAELSPAQQELVSAGLLRLGEVRTKRFAENTRRSYRYWCDRYARWLADPEVRNRPEWRSLPALTGLEATPVPINEQTLLLFLDDVIHDPDAAASGTLGAPGTLTTIIAAVSAAAREVEMPWTPSGFFNETVTGMRRTLAERHQIDRAAPITLRELRPACERLYAYRSPPAVRDTAVIELTRLGAGLAVIARLTVGSLRRPDGSITAVTAADNAAIHAATGKVGRAAIVDHTGTLWTLDDDAAAAVQAAVDLVPGRSADEPLLDLAASNRRAHVRSILVRAARDAGVDWKPSTSPTATAHRAMLDSVRSIGRGHAKAVRDRAILLIGWAAALRRSEICALNLGDVETRVDGVHLRIRKSKTDTTSRGETLPIRRGKHPATDPVSALQEWIAVLDPDGTAPRDTPLFQSLDRHGNLVAGAVNPSPRRKTTRRTGRLNGEDIQAVIRTRLEEAGIATGDALAEFSGHSLRRGFITEAASQGHDALAISKQSRHKTLSIVAQYVDDARALEQSVAGKLGL
jgi:integrase